MLVLLEPAFRLCDLGREAQLLNFMVTMEQRHQIIPKVKPHHRRFSEFLGKRSAMATQVGRLPDPSHPWRAWGCSKDGICVSRCIGGDAFAESMVFL